MASSFTIFWKGSPSEESVAIVAGWEVEDEVWLMKGQRGGCRKAAAYAAASLVTQGQEDDWFEFQRLTRTFIKVYADLSPDPAILDFIAEVKWAAAFLRLATQAISKDESLDHRSYSGKIRDVLEQHVHPSRRAGHIARKHPRTNHPTGQVRVKCRSSSTVAATTSY